MSTRQKPMKLIVGGMPRTSTVSITSALRELGFTPYDYPTRLLNGHLPQWNRMLKAKYQGSQQPLDRQRLDRLTGDYDCISDAPCFFLVEELARAFPMAKVLLNEREVTAWLVSIRKTMGESYKADLRWSSRPLRWLDPTFARPIMICDELAAGMLCDHDYSNTSKLHARYVQHYNAVGQLDKHRLLRYRVQEGWKPLCDFLGVPVPDHPFPRLNDSAALQEVMRQSWWTAVRNSLRNFLGGAVVALLISMALMRFGMLRSFLQFLSSSITESASPP